MKLIGSVFVFSIIAPACGGGDGSSIGNSGVPTGVEIVDVTPDEAQALCEYIIGLLEQPERQVDCGNGQVVTVGINPENVDSSIAKCVMQLEMVPGSCTATVGDFETCFEVSASASDAQICSPDLPPSCSPVAPCI